MKAPIICKGDTVRICKPGSDHDDAYGTLVSSRTRNDGTFVGYLVQFQNGSVGTYQRCHLEQVSSPATTAAFLAWWFSHPRCVILGDTLMGEGEFTFTITTTPSEVQALLDGAAYDCARGYVERWSASRPLRDQLILGVWQ